MKSQSIRILFFLCCLKLSAQIKFEKGYFVDTQNKKIECFIKNKDWIGMPNEIEYKLSDSSPIITVVAKDLTELKIENTSHYYKKYSVLIDKNTDVNRDNFIEETAFFKVLIEGKVSLLEYCGDRLYFYQTEKGAIKSLKYKKYADNDKIIRQDNSFRRELFDNLKCEDITIQIATKLKYEKEDLVKFFATYNKCRGSDYQDFSKKETKLKFNVKVIAGASLNNNIKPNIYLFADNEANKTSITAKCSAKPSIVLGFELEVLLPFNKHNWALFSSPTYQTYSVNSSNDYNGVHGYYVLSTSPSGQPVYESVTYDFRLHAEYKYSYIELPIGIRRYFYLNDNSKWFVDGSYGVIFQGKEPVERVEVEQVYNGPLPALLPQEIKKQSSSAIKLSAGYSFKDNYSVSLSYIVNKQLSNSRGNAFSVLFSYKLL